MRRSLSLVWAGAAAGLLVVCLGVWLLAPARFGAVGRRAAEPPSEREAQAASLEPALAARGGSSAGLAEAREEPAGPSGTGAGEPAERGPISLFLSVTDESGAPVPRASVRYGLRNRDDYGVVRGNGVLMLSNRPTGSVVRFRVEHPCDESGAPLPLAPVDIEVPDSRDHMIEVPIVLPPAKHITGIVLGPDGRGLANVAVWAQEGSAPRKSDPQPADSFDTVDTDAEGRFDLGGRGAFAYDLIAFPSCAEKGLLPGTLDGVMGGTQGVRITVRASVSARLILLDPEGRPARNAVVSADRSPAEPSWATWIGPNRADDGGSVLLEGLDPAGSYELLARAPGVAMTRIPGWRPRDETIRLPPLRSIRGVVRDLTGRPVPRVHVDWVGRPNPNEGCAFGGGHPDPGYVETDTDGAFTLDEVPPGEIVVTYELHEDVAGAPVEQRVPPEGTVADQTLDVGKSISVRVDGRPGTRLSVRLFVQTAGGSGGWKCTRACYGAAVPEPVTFRGTVPGADYSLLIRDGSSHIAWRTGVRAGDDLSVALGAGLTIRGHVMSACILDGRTRVAVPPFGLAEAERDGAFAVDGLPPGTWRVIATAESDGQPLVAEADAEAGGEVMLTLRNPAAPK